MKIVSPTSKLLMRQGVARDSRMGFMGIYEANLVGWFIDTRDHQENSKEAATAAGGERNVFPCGMAGDSA